MGLAGTLLLVLCLAVMAIHRTEGVMVLRFQEDRVASLETVAWYKGHLDPGRNLHSVTLCARFTLFTLHAWATFFALTNSRGDHHILEGDIWLERVRPVLARNWNFQILNEKLWVYKWHHLCFTYDHRRHLISTYVDGWLNNHQEYDIQRSMAGDRARLGQGTKAQRSFSGDLTQVNVWDRPLNESEIRAITKCQVDLQGNYVSWEAGWTLHNITSYEASMESFCQQEIGDTYFWFPLIPHQTATYLCQALGSHLPSGTNMEEVLAMLNVSEVLFQANHSCYTDFWTAVTDEEEEGVWKIDNRLVEKEVTWAPQEPNGLQYENCGSVVDYGVSDVDCKSNFRCVVCTISEQQRYSLLGTCEDELRNVYFTPFQPEASKLLFIGYGAYHIKKQDNIWTWINVVSNLTIARMQETMPDYPMGRRWWYLEQPVCGQEAGGDRRLLLSPCPPQHFTCDDATCIPLAQRCDLRYNCRDNSDELDCDLVAFPKGYQKHLPPRNPLDEDASLPITLTIYMDALNVKTIDMIMEVSYVLELTWLDSRLYYHNLKMNVTLNMLPPGLMKKLWSPEVGFINVISSSHTLMDGDTTMLIERQEDAVGMEKAAPAEVELFPGSANPMRVGRKYGTVFLCDLDLALYPFDKQECHMHLRLTSATKTFLAFDELASSVSYSAGNLMVEYEIGQLTLSYNDSGMFSNAWVRVPLKRRYGYAILNIYLPTLVLLVVSYVTLFFRPAIFDVRMMSALTVQLVIATLFSQVSSSLPKTSYFKMVDVWLIFCIGITFLTIIFHVAVDNVVNQDYAENEVNTPMKLSPGKRMAWVGKETRENLTTEGKLKKTHERNQYWILMVTKLTVPAVFIVFNLVYWSYLLG